MNSAKLYIGNLTYSVTDEQLKELFSQAGTVVSASVIVNKYTNKSKGFGFVEMSSPEEAQKAKDMFDGTEYEGRKILVNEARPQEKKGEE